MPNEHSPEICRYCDGTGVVEDCDKDGDKRCGNCDGTGYVRRAHVDPDPTIPPGGSAVWCPYRRRAVQTSLTCAACDDPTCRWSDMYFGKPPKV